MLVIRQSEPERTKAREFFLQQQTSIRFRRILFLFLLLLFLLFLLSLLSISRGHIGGRVFVVLKAYLRTPESVPRSF